jgi:cytoskeleton protein RodZ
MATGIGETLREARRRRGYSLADAAASTRVRESHLAALEEDEFGALGSDVYVRGFLRSYAKFLGLDADALLEQYRGGEGDGSGGGGAGTSPGHRAAVGTHAPRRTPARVLVAAIGVVVVIALLVAGLGTEAGAAGTARGAAGAGAPGPGPA